MGMKITFVNPNTEQEADKYLPKVLAEAVINKIARETSVRASGHDGDYSSKQSA